MTTAKRIELKLKIRYLACVELARLNCVSAKSRKYRLKMPKFELIVRFAKLHIGPVYLKIKSI